MEYWNLKHPIAALASLIWNLADKRIIPPLGRFAPYIFGLMIGSSGYMKIVKTVKTGVEIIAEERKRQIEVEGYTSEHDDREKNGELARAAACYAVDGIIANLHREYYDSYGWVPCLWPYSWSPEFWKPTPNDRVRELAKAGALIAAEIDRLQRINK